MGLRRFLELLVILSTLITYGSTTSKSAGELSDDLFFTFTLNDIRGNPVNFERFRGKATLLVNTASQCSQTESQLKSLKRIHDILAFGDVFNVVAFPCNEFGEQEPWDNQEIEEYYRGHFKIEFIILEKGSVQSELWKWVKGKSVDPAWNFHKYLIDGNGKIVKNWSGDVSVESIFEDVHAVIKSSQAESAKPVKTAAASSTSRSRGETSDLDEDVVKVTKKKEEL